MLDNVCPISYSWTSLTLITQQISIRVAPDLLATMFDAAANRLVKVTKTIRINHTYTGYSVQSLLPPAAEIASAWQECVLSDAIDPGLNNSKRLYTTMRKQGDNRNENDHYICKCH